MGRCLWRIIGDLGFSGVWFSQVIGIDALSLMGGLSWILFVTVMVFVSILGISRSLCTSECEMSKTRVNYCWAWRFS